MSEAIKEFETFANDLLGRSGGQALLIEHIEREGAPVDAVELLETLRAPRGPVLRLMLQPLGDGSVYMMAVRTPPREG